MSDVSRNAAGKLANTFVTSKLTLLFILACLLFGTIAVLTTPREENPQIDVPGAAIQVVLPGATSSEVEELVIRPLEGIVKQISGVDHVYATAVPSAMLMTVQFKVGEDKERSLVKLYDRVLGAKDMLPAGASFGLRSADADDVPVVTVTLASDKYDDYALKRLADRVVEGLRSLPAASTTFVKGGRDRELRIEIDPDRMQAFGITLDQLHLVVASSDVSAPLGTQVHKGINRKITFDGFVASPQDLETLIVGANAGRPIYLRDVAQVKDGPPDERERVSRFAFGPANPQFGKTQGELEMPAVTVAVAKKRGSNAVDFANGVLERVDRMKHEFIPKDVNVVVTRNDGEKADNAVNTLIEHLAIAIAAVFLVTAAFLGLKEALIVGITVPLILALTLGVAELSGLTINRVSLFALILALGLLVDAAIVVIENIHRHYAHLGKQSKVAACVDATNEIGNPTNLATLAVMVVFMAIIPSLSGMPKPYFFPIGFIVPLAMAASLLVAYAVVPWAANRWLAVGDHHEGEAPASNSRMLRGYRAMLGTLMNQASKRRAVFIGVLVLIALVLMQPLWQFIRPSGVGGAMPLLGVEVGFLPKDNKNTFNITINTAETSPVEVTDALTREVGALLRDMPDVDNYQSWIGQAGVVDFTGMLRGSVGKVGSHIAEVRVNLAPKEKRDKSSMALVSELREKIKKISVRYPGATVQVTEDPAGPPVRATVLAEIYGKDAQQMRQISARVKAEFLKTYEMTEVNDTEPVDVPRHRLTVDREKAALSGISGAEVAMALRRLIDGEQLAVAHMPGERNPIPIRLMVPRQHEIDTALLERVSLTNRFGLKVPLSSLVKVQTDVEDRPIQHKDGERVTFVGGELGRTVPAYAVLDLDRRLRGMQLADGNTLKTGNLGLFSKVPDTISGPSLLWDGELRMTLDTYRDMSVALFAAMTLVFLILVAYYESFTLALIAMAAIPLCLVGVIPGHWILGQTFSGTSMIGVIALAGVVVRNSLLIIDFVLDNLRRGMSPEQAVMEAGALRLRPILLTALAIIFGSVVMLSDPVFSGLAVSLIFGTAASTVLTVVVIPLLLLKQARRGPLVNVLPAPTVERVMK